jgi:hypothetical protein
LALRVEEGEDMLSRFRILLAVPVLAGLAAVGAVTPAVAAEPDTSIKTNIKLTASVVKRAYFVGTNPDPSIPGLPAQRTWYPFDASTSSMGTNHLAFLTSGSTIVTGGGDSGGDAQPDGMTWSSATNCRQGSRPPSSACISLDSADKPGYAISVTQIQSNALMVEPTMCLDKSGHDLTTLGTAVGFIPFGNWAWSLGFTTVSTLVPILDTGDIRCRSLGDVPIALVLGAHNAAYAPPTTRTFVDIVGESREAGPEVCRNYENCTRKDSYTVTIQSDYDGTLYSGPYPESTYVPIAPSRIMDSRTGSALLANKAWTFQVTKTKAPNGAVIVPAGAVAVTGNLTATQESALGYLYLGPVPMDVPTSSTLNFPALDDRANGVTVPLSSEGWLSVTYVAAKTGAFEDGPTTHFIFDVTGYYVAGTSKQTFGSVAPTRVLDTRINKGVVGHVYPNTPVTFAVTSLGGVPSNALAVAGNLTVTNSQSKGYLFLGPNPMPIPTSSTLNFPKGESRANNVVVMVGAGGNVALTFVGPGPWTDAIFDVTGYYISAPTGASYVPVVPSRIVDTRSNLGAPGPLSSDAVRTFGVRGANHVSSDAIAITGNLTATRETVGGYLYLGSGTSVPPATSTVNFAANDSRANGVIVGLNLSVYPIGSLALIYHGSGGTAHAILDLTGFYMPIKA